MERSEIIVTVLDGLGGGIGKSLVERLKKAFPDLHVRALGTNAEATARMLRAGADDGATGENAVVVNVARCQMVLGVVSILASNGLMGEITPAMARAVGECEAVKILIPMERCHIRIPAEPVPVSRYLERAVELVGEERERLLSK
ncbi:MAG: DUF3842 family protein [Pseudoflavonifractor sp.]